MTEKAFSDLEVQKDVGSSAASDQDREPADASVPSRSVTGWKWALVCVSIYLASFLYGLDNTIAADAQGPILTSLGEIKKLGWVGIGFPLGSVATILPIGAAYGTFSIKYIYLGSIVLFEVGSAVCGAAPHMDAMIVGRVLAGVGGAGVYLGGLTYMTIMTTHKERSNYVGGIGIAWAIGTILGPVISGAFADSSATWRWAFYINLVIAAVTAPVYILWLPTFQPQPDVSTARKFRQLDWLGATLIGAIIILFVVAASFSGSSWAWDSATSIGLWTGFGIALVVCFVQQYLSILTTPERRIFPCHFLKSRSLILLYVATAGAAAALFLTIYYVPLFFQFTRGDSAIRASVRLLPCIFLFVFGVMLSGALLPAVGFYSPWYIIGGCFSLAGSVLMYKVSSDTSTAAIYGYTVLIAFGTGLNAQMAYSIGAVKVKPQDVPAVVSYINMGQIGAFAIALALATSIFQNIGYNNIAAVLGPAGASPMEIRAALAGTKNAFVSGDKSIQASVLDAVVSTISTEYILAIVGSAVVIVCGGLMRLEKVTVA